MLPTINGKSFLEVTEDDLKVLVENAKSYDRILPNIVFSNAYNVSYPIKNVNRRTV